MKYMKNSLSLYLSPERLERVLCLSETESTNTYLREISKSAPHGQAVIAKSQRGGRGRQGRTFASPEGGLYLSVLYRFEASPTAFTACTAVAVRRAIKRVCGLEPGIKWVNDLFLEGKKLCGILSELHGNALIVGVGLNVNTAAFPPELTNAASLAQIGGREYPIAALAAAIIEELDALSADFPRSAEAYRAEYAAACLNIGREVLLTQGEHSRRAFAEAIEEDFSLLVRYGDGSRERLFYGEVSLRSPDGSWT